MWSLVFHSFDWYLVAPSKCARTRIVFINAPHILQPVDIAGEHVNNSALNFELSTTELPPGGEKDPELIPRAWWQPNPERTKGIGLAESLAVIKDVLQTRKFDVSVSSSSPKRQRF
jgi:hypothetical protein